MSTQYDENHEQPADQQPLAEHDRLAQPVDTEEPPRLAFPVVGIGASAGGLEAFIEFFKAMRGDSGIAFVLIQHLPPDRDSLISEILARHTSMPVHEVEHGMVIEPNHVYVIRPNSTLTLRDGRLLLGDRPQQRRNIHPVDDFFKSLAEEQRERAICIIMSGMGSNGSAGAQAIKATGGLCIAQDPEEAQFPSMPRHLIDAGYSDYVLSAEEMPDVLLSYVGHSYTRGDRDRPVTLATDDQQHLREILAVLRSRTRQDFTGYKKPTLFRRVQRRMGVNRIATLREYAKLLRQSPTEVSGLADDLLIHVTGFFRDAEAWESLRERVIAPLVASREQDASVRCWVTACSSGEEAYTLAMLLTEEADRAGKRLDIKVFATDMAERTLSNARQGVYPGGIEMEITPERLERAFLREEEQFRIRPELRECVVFAPQNILQDPPFSRLDIVTCRNLLIYLEPEVQKRVLAMLHFGLREGGSLFLGTSETVGGAEELFGPLDKKARIFRRIGPTRHGTIDFPLPNASASPADSRYVARMSMSQLTTRALLEHHTPSAVLVDRDYRVVYFHGKTDLFLTQPRGEATRDLMALLRDNVRGAVRLALQQAAASKEPATVLDGWIETGAGKRLRIAVMASPLENKGVVEYYVVSFQDRGLDLEGFSARTEQLAGNSGDHGELKVARDELQSAVEQLQTSNEELKASHEEVMSINEELQSTNEELETSREELQSLNEELITVNAQLHAKMEDHQAARNDLVSLLSSTDIAVLFLDTELRIRRFTTPLKDLLELISSDVGRPLADLARKFDDPNLLDETQMVLERLVPAERELAANDGRWFLRRITPYRTIDNRIDGVVIAFVDITRRRAVEESFLASRTELEAEIQAMAALQASALGLLSANDEPKLIDNLLASVMEIHGADMGNIQLLDPRTETLQIAASQRFDEAFLTAMSLQVVGNSRPCQRAARLCQTVVVKDIQHDPSYEDCRELAKKGGFRGVVSIPLIDRESKVFGILSTYFRQPHLPDERAMRFSELHVRYANEVLGRMRAEQAIRAADSLLRGFFDHAAVGMCEADLTTGKLLNVNQAICRMTGFSEGELLDRTLLEISHPEDQPANLTAFLAAMRGSAPYFHGETRLVTKEGETIWVRVNIGSVLASRFARARIVVMIEDISKQYHNEVALRELNSTLETRVSQRSAELAGANEARNVEARDRERAELIRVELLRRLVTAQEDERRRIARELHDEMGQLLAALIIEIRSLESTELNERARAKLRQAQDLADQIGREVHDLALQLRPTALDDLGLQAALAQFTETWSARSNMGVDLHVPRVEERFSAEVETVLYRVVQEAMTNVVKHSMATRVSVIVDRQGTDAVAIIEDNGRGFDFERLVKSGQIHQRLGLLGMRERLATVGGNLEIESIPGKGTTIYAHVPIVPDRA